jgi:hypothetical protein
LPIRGTPDRWKLLGSHGQRPWLHDVVIKEEDVERFFDSVEVNADGAA